MDFQSIALPTELPNQFPTPANDARKRKEKILRTEARPVNSGSRGIGLEPLFAWHRRQRSPAANALDCPFDMTERVPAQGLCPGTLHASQAGADLKHGQPAACRIQFIGDRQGFEQTLPDQLQVCR